MTGSDIQDLPNKSYIYIICGSLVISALLMVDLGKWKNIQVDALNFDNEIKVGVKTISSFTFENVEEKSSIPFETEFVTDENKDKCSEEVEIQKGENGVLTKIIEVTYYKGKEFDRRQIDKKIFAPVVRKIAQGTKTVYKTLATANGDISYSCNLGIFRATAYDSNCRGCNETTAIGLKAGFGVVAVDPKVIPLRTKLYITGYGIAVAGDTGGAIKGKKIDLGFDKIDRSWGVRNVEVYVL